jgi:hypothetical protein
MRIIAPSFYARAKPVSISIFNSDDGLDLYASKPDPRRLKTERPRGHKFTPLLRAEFLGHMMILL